jgi:uncharacterized membrane protein YidH (DUF202 family)
MSRQPSGLQQERTELAWRRTVLSLLVGGLLGIRVLPSTLGAWAVPACLLVLALTGLTWVLARRRAQVVARALQEADQLPGGAVLLLIALLLSGTAALALTYVARH